jgi:regulator of sigma E protease
MSWLLAFAGFAALIILHEFGHFAAAKAVGMRVERFALFFPPLIFKVRRGETEYGIGCIPLGGYVRISGMNPREELPPDVAPRAYYLQKPWKRIVVILAGPFMNVLVAFVIFLGLFATEGGASNRVAVTASQPARSILRPGDQLVAVDGITGSPARLRNAITAHHCAAPPTNGCQAATPVRLTVVRNGRVLHLQARPRYDAQEGRTLLGFGFGTASEPIGQAASDAGSSMWRITTGTVSAIGKLFYSSKARKDVHGIVGSYETTRVAIGLSASDALNILAIISLSLAIVNLFPFLPLDGGHVFWALAEKVRGRAIPFSVMERAGIFGFLLVAFLFVIGLTNDINTLRGKGFGPP